MTKDSDFDNLNMHYFPEGEDPGDIGEHIVNSVLNQGLHLQKEFAEGDKNAEVVAVIPGQTAGKTTEVKLGDIQEVEIGPGHAKFHIKEHLKEVVITGFAVGAVAATVWHRRHKP